MSGERIVLTDDTDGTTARLVHVTARLAGVGLGPHALIGGLAVMCRLAAVHRATQDVDTVTETRRTSTTSIGSSSPTTGAARSPRRPMAFRPQYLSRGPNYSGAYPPRSTAGRWAPGDRSASPASSLAEVTGRPDRQRASELSRTVMNRLTMSKHSFKRRNTAQCHRRPKT